MKNKILKEINVEEIMEEIKKNPEENNEFKVLWNGKEIEVYLDYYDFEKEVDEVRENLTNGSALSKCEAMIQAQGGDLDDLYRQSSVQYIVDVVADDSGYIMELPAMEFGLFAMRLGAGRAVKSDHLDFETGIVFEKKVGEAIETGDVIARIYSNQKITEEVVTEFKKNVRIGNEQKKVSEIIEVIA